MKKDSAFAKATEEILVKREASLQRHIVRSMIMATSEETKRDLKEIDEMESALLSQIEEKFK